MTPRLTPTEALAAVGVARDRREESEPTRVLDSLGREWVQRRSGSWGAIGHDVTADSLADIEATYGPVEVLA